MLARDGVMAMKRVDGPDMPAAGRHMPRHASTPIPALFAQTGTAAKKHVARSKLSLLYVDEFDAEGRRIAERFRTSPHYDISFHRAETTAKALDLCREAQFDIAIMDIWVGHKTTAAIIDAVHDACIGGIIVLTELRPDVVRSAVGDLDGIVVISKESLDDAAADRALTAACPPRDGKMG